MKHQTILLSLCMLWACGSDDQEGSSSSPIITLALKNYDDLPSCDTSNENQLAYVKSEKLFYECSSGEWIEVNIKGKDGIDGSDGSNGVDGDDGTDGVDGSDGIEYSDSIWVDPFTEDHWIIATVGKSPFWYPDDVPCETGYHIPSIDEAILAGQHGMRFKLELTSFPLVMWTWEKNDGCPECHTGEAVDISAEPFTFTDARDDVYGLYCLQD